MRRLFPMLFLTMLVFLTLAPMALAADSVPDPNSHLPLPTDLVWTLIIGTLVPGVMYLVNHFAPWTNDKVKGLITLGVSAAAGALYQMQQAGTIDFNDQTLQFVAAAVIATFAAHGLFWKPTGLDQTLKAGTNKQDS